ncbi:MULTISPECIES: glycosyltransferase [Pseudomonas]|uniref:glycosyltransferase n=1 Tax=Pseudomonas TaxID=286 RepID=UPI001E592C5A|nr:MULTISPECIES: glycosyltransferase family 4 protein [Pseudomonas]MCE1118447.1 glycosyltransferase family 4 protein [Pseudomonas sp. NMI795_08]
MPHLLVLSHRWPEQQACSAGQHLQQILQTFLARGWQVTFASAAQTGERKADLVALGVLEQHISTDNASLFARQTADVVLFDSFTSEERYASQVTQHIPQALRVLLTDGLQSLREARQQLLRRRLIEGLDPNDFRALFATSGPELYRQMAPLDLTQRELAAIWRCDLTLLTSQAELDLLVNGFGVPEFLLHYCPPMVEPAATLRPFAERQHFVSLGDFASAAQHDALLWLRHNLWPVLRRQLPEAQLHLYGTNPSAKSMALHAPEQGLHVMGETACAGALLAGARVCLAPLRSGAGIEGALLDALRHGTPSVTTPIGAEGIQGQQPWPGSIADTAEGLAKVAAQLYSDEAQWQRAQDACWPLLMARFDRQRHATVLLGRIEHSLLHRHEQRLYNFVGAMLRRERR